MSPDLEWRFHEQWLGMAQPLDGLVVSIPALAGAQCMARLPPAAHARFLTQLSEGRIADLDRFLAEVLELGPERFDRGDALPEALSLWVPEGRQLVRPTLALEAPEGGYLMLVWDLAPHAGLPLDRPETSTGPWLYPPAAKFDRLLRAARVPIGLLTNREELRLVYAPHGESSGSITFRVADMATVGGRPLLDALCMLLSARRFFAVGREHQLPQLLADSRRRQANVTNTLAEQVLEALGLLLTGFEAAAERDRSAALDDALRTGPEEVYGGLLSVLLRLVFLLYAEDQSLMPVEVRLYAEHFSVLGLFERLQQDAGQYPDSMSRRFGAWPRLVALFRAVFFGAAHGELRMPPRHGDLFNPETYPFLEGRLPGGGAPHVSQEHREAVRLPTVDDETIYRVLDRLLMLEGQRLSYRALDVEQIGSVYEALMGYRVERVPSRAVCVKPHRVWIAAAEVLQQPPARRAAWVEEAADLEAKAVKAISGPLREAKSEEDVLAALEEVRVRQVEALAAGRLVLQPGKERRRTSSHYTPRSLSAPIVERTLAPLLAAMGPTPSAERLLSLKVCDPAMGSGAFLVAACRYLADQVVAAWTRDGQLEANTREDEDVTMRARRLVAQRCLYGVDKNPFAVSLAKMSLWLATLAKEEPFTFLDHSLRHGDSLLGLDLKQLQAFHWKPAKQAGLFEAELRRAMTEALELRLRILELARERTAAAVNEKERLLRDADDAVRRVRLIGDLVIGAFLENGSDRERNAERQRRLGLVEGWLASGELPPDELEELAARVRERSSPFHWMIELPEVFYAERPDPLQGDQRNQVAWMDAFVGNPPFAGKNGISEMGGPGYLPWLQAIHEGAHGNADYSAHFFRRAVYLLGKHGTFGLIATNTIAQGDTRASALKPIVESGGVIYGATRSMQWPGDANVAVSVVHVALGSAAACLKDKPRLDGVEVEVINSRLRAKPERPDPVPLKANAEKAFQGSIVLGMGFVLTPAEYDGFVASDPRNAQRIFPYIGGEEINGSSDQSFERYVIHFGSRSLEEAQAWPELLRRVRELVKPERDQLNDNADGRRRKTHWWQFGRDTPSLYEAISPLPRCLAMSRHTKHLVFSFQPSGRVFAESLCVFALSRGGDFAVLQSRIHEQWARLLSSSMREDLRYSVSDCFETFPFPRDLDALDDIGERLYRRRSEYMRAHRVGLTETYNRLKDPRRDEADLVELRELHLDLDRAVLAAYERPSIAVPPYPTPQADGERQALARFEDEVIDLLFALNAERAAEEERLGTAKPAKKSRRASKDQLELDT